jgi:hypothetical protein
MKSGGAILDGTFPVLSVGQIRFKITMGFSCCPWLLIQTGNRIFIRTDSAIEYLAFEEIMIRQIRVSIGT